MIHPNQCDDTLSDLKFTHNSPTGPNVPRNFTPRTDILGDRLEQTLAATKQNNTYEKHEIISLRPPPLR